MFRLLLIFLSAYLPVFAHAQQTPEDWQKKFEEILYGDLKKIESFGFIHVHVKNEEKNKIGMKSEGLTDYLKLRYKNNFSTVAFKSDVFPDKEEVKPKVGYLWCGVWTVGDNYPVAYHVECKLGSWKKSDILEDAVLGYGTKENIPESIRKTLDQIVSRFAIQFYKVRGEM